MRVYLSSSNQGKPLAKLSRVLLTMSRLRLPNGGACTLSKRCMVMQSFERPQCFADKLSGDQKSGACPGNCPDWLVKFIGQISGYALPFPMQCFSTIASMLARYRCAMCTSLLCMLKYKTSWET